MSIIAKYKFDKTIYADLLPEFNAEFTSDKYNTTDEEVDGIITRTIESDELPTLMRFGRVWVEGESDADNRTDSLLEVLDLNTSGLTSCSNMFRYNKNLTSITCEWDTSNVTNMQYMFVDCTNLASLDTSNFNTSNATDMFGMFFNCYNLTSLDVSNFNTSKVTTMSNMFFNCNNLTSLDLSNFNTSNVTDMGHMFYNCNKLITLDVSNFNTSNVTNMSSMFCNCNNLTSLDVSNFNTSKVTNTHDMFSGCFKLTSLDVSNFNTSKITNMIGMFYNCTKLTSLDVSNFDTSKVTDMTDMFYNTLLLTDIGMLYCDQSTINKIASVLPTNTTQTIWVEDVDIKDLTPVEGVEFKQYAKNTEIMLTSPLLEGDKLIVKDGKLYHWHKMCKVVLDGSEDLQYAQNINSDNTTYRQSIAIDNLKNVSAYDKPNIFCDKFQTLIFNTEMYADLQSGISQWLDISLVINNNYKTVEELKQWLQANPITVVYELASPYYELISENPLDISLIAESSDITNSSNIPLNMTINNKGLSTVAISPSTTYTVAFDKDTDGEVVVNLCGNEVTTTDNIVEITTPSEIDDELIFYGDGVEVSNVRLLEGSVSGDSIPGESFEGLKNSFEDGYIPESELVDFPTDIYLNGTSYNEGNGDGYNVYYHTVSLKTNTVYTVFCNINEETTCTDGLGLRLVIDVGVEQCDIITGDLTAMKGVCCRTFISPNTLRETNNLEIWNRDKGVISISNMTILEGDWTHLTEEDWNNLGKYKVEYKVTGKNKYNKDKYPFGDGYSLANSNTNTEGFDEVTSRSEMFKLLPNTTYTYSADLTLDSNVGSAELFALLFDDSRGRVSVNSIGIVSTGRYSVTFSTDSVGVYCELRFDNNLSKTGNEGIVTIDNIQLEEGSVATPYEPYKSYTKTFYLSSPLLEGDTIEDINGVATHVKRYEKVVLDGSEDLTYYGKTNDNTWSFVEYYNVNMKLQSSVINDRFPYSDIRLTNNSLGISNVQLHAAFRLRLTENDSLESIRAYLQANPTTVVYELASPIYEPISTESILCDSYVNGHLDVDTNIPIEKVAFRNSWVETKYLIPNTDYILQFEADNNGKIDAYHLGGTNLNNQNVTKGLNTVRIASTNNIINTRVYLEGIGFNASNIQVVATDRNADFGYFKGLQSSFENNVKNLWDGVLVEGVHITTSSTYDNSGGKTRSACIKCRPNTTYAITATNNDRLRIGHVSELVGGIVCMISDIDDTNIRYKEFTTAHREGYLIVYVANESNTNENITVDIREKVNRVKCKVVGKNLAKLEIPGGHRGYGSGVFVDSPSYNGYIAEVKENTTYTISNYHSNLCYYDKNMMYIKGDAFIGNDAGTSVSSITTPQDCKYISICAEVGNNLQLEEGTQATSYEPYQEYTKTIYLNSPLLKGDTIEVHNGKLCHYHKMGMIVLDGSDDETFVAITDTSEYGGTVTFAGVELPDAFADNTKCTVTCDRFASIHGNAYDYSKESIYMYQSSSYNYERLYLHIYTNKLSGVTVRQYLQENPTTVVYELAEPWYEEISPTQEDLIITSVKEGDLHIDTIVPISSKVTYNVNVQLLTDFEQSIVEQVQATQTTDLQSILDEEIDN